MTLKFYFLPHFILFLFVCVGFFLFCITCLWISSVSCIPFNFLSLSSHSFRQFEFCSLLISQGAVNILFLCLTSEHGEIKYFLYLFIDILQMLVAFDLYLALFKFVSWMQFTSYLQCIFFLSSTLLFYLNHITYMMFENVTK